VQIAKVSDGVVVGIVLSGNGFFGILSRTKLQWTARIGVSPGSIGRETREGGNGGNACADAADAAADAADALH
jgi:hypothetical protein